VRVSSQVQYFAGMPERAAPAPGSVAAVLMEDLRRLGMHRYI